MSKHKDTLSAAVIAAIGGHPLCSCPGCNCVVDKAHADKFVEAIAPTLQQIVDEDVTAAAAHHISVGAEIARDLSA